MSGCSSSRAPSGAAAAFRADELFEPGRSVLTQSAEARLDEIGRWCKQASRPTSEVVIAAFTDDDRDQDLAEILTQEQAEPCASTGRQALDPVGRLVQEPQGRRRRLRHPLAPNPRPVLEQRARRAASRSSCSLRRLDGSSPGHLVDTFARDDQ